MKRRVMSMALCLALLVTMFIVPTGALASSTIQLLKVTVDGARVRSGPSSAYSVITSVKKGGRVFYLGPTKNSFCRICTSDGKIGYMYRGFLKAYGAVNKDQVYYCRVKSAKVYKRSGSGLKRAGTLYKYQFVIVYEVRGSWAYIKSLTGKSGYIKTSALAKANPG